MSGKRVHRGAGERGADKLTENRWLRAYMMMMMMMMVMMMVMVMMVMVMVMMVMMRK